MRSAGYTRWWQGRRTTILQVIREDTPRLKVTPDVLRLFIRRRMRDVSASTIAHHRPALHRLLVLAHRDGIVSVNPTVDVTWPEARPRPVEFFTMEELRSVFCQLQERASQLDQDVVQLFALTGLRLAEGARLTAKNVDLDNGTLWVRGKRRDESVVIPEELRPVVDRLITRAGTGRLLGTEHAISQRLRKLADRQGESRLRTHVLRQTYATQLIRHGERIDVVKHVLRHRSIATTMRYVHLVQDDAKAAANRFKLLPPLDEADHA